jgi:hypothetical protein
MRAVLAGLSERGPRWNSPMESRLAAIPLTCKQPKTRPRLGTKNRVRSLNLIPSGPKDHGHVSGGSRLRDRPGGMRDPCLKPGVLCGLARFDVAQILWRSDAPRDLARDPHGLFVLLDLQTGATVSDTLAAGAPLA